MNKIIYGIHSVQKILEIDYLRFQEVYVLQENKNKRLLSLIHQFKNLGIITNIVNRKWMDRKTENAVHQGIVALVKPGKKYKESDLVIMLSHIKIPFILILDCITDPYNLGACLRSADAAGVDMVIIPKDKSANLNSIAKKVACGAAESIPLIRVTNLAQTLRQLQKNHIRIIGTVTKSNYTLYNTELTGSIALVMGTENKGIRHLTKKNCDDLVCIPMLGEVNSLNVSVATGICLFEIVRQRFINV
ncbi:23S rRNA (guanosine(2251)-2'-O)-methyltransferase RlmB [Arsenophonus symbiont of Ornithomya chloropus]|uniref:23S rRNA (guanosine(2251)-2'-O)-methyltransferase RlmB n=1 Tax=Arsenophonus symbiont of Ornithomya chloropus TaxID=634121 RepID=UPI0032B15F8C